MRTVEEARPGDGGVPLWRHPEWNDRFPWLVQGTTGAGEEDEPFDLGLSGTEPVGVVLDRWRRVRAGTGMRAVVHSRQVHGTELCEHPGPGGPGLLVLDGYDGHLTRAAALLLSVSVADCVPVSIVDERRTVALLHAGWRGVAGGIVERALARLAERFGSRADALWLHCGPAICGVCYEVGPEVHRAVWPDREAPDAPAPVDLRAAIAARAAGWGVAPARITSSAHCTRCGPGAFFSHRGGSAARQMALLGLRG